MIAERNFSVFTVLSLFALGLNYIMQLFLGRLSLAVLAEYKYISVFISYSTVLLLGAKDSFLLGYAKGEDNGVSINGVLCSIFAPILILFSFYFLEIISISQVLFSLSASIGLWIEAMAQISERQNVIVINRICFTVVIATTLAVGGVSWLPYGGVMLLLIETLLLADLLMNRVVSIGVVNYLNIEGFKIQIMNWVAQFANSLEKWMPPLMLGQLEYAEYSLVFLPFVMLPFFVGFRNQFFIKRDFYKEVQLGAKEIIIFFLVTVLLCGLAILNIYMVKKILPDPVLLILICLVALATSVYQLKYQNRLRILPKEFLLVTLFSVLHISLSYVVFKNFDIQSFLLVVLVGLNLKMFLTWKLLK